MIGIYKITSPSKRVYIGQSINIEKRFANYSKIYNCNNQTKLYNSFKKYGVENHSFEVVIECKESQLNELERYYQDLYNVIHPKHGLNCKLTKSSDKKVVLSEETKKKISEKAKNREVPEHVKEMLRTNFLGRKHTEVSLEKMRKNNARANLGKKASDETRRKISMNNSRHNSKLVINIQSGIFYNSIKEAASSTDFKYDYIKTNLNGTTLKNRTNFRLI